MNVVLIRVRLPGDVRGSHSVTRTVAIKNLSWVQLQVLQKLQRFWTQVAQSHQSLILKKKKKVGKHCVNAAAPQIWGELIHSYILIHSF